MEIFPNTEVRILSGIPWDSTYQNTMWFPDAATQVFELNKKVKYSHVNYSYQRETRNYIRVEIRTDDLWDCNYLMFKNTAYGNKWFYAFIKKLEWLNNEVTRVEYEIDILQTWMFDYTLLPSFIEREHTASDNLFEHTVHEDITIGDEYVCDHSDSYDMNSLRICAVMNKELADNKDIDPTDPDMTNIDYYPPGMHSGLYLPVRIVTTPVSNSAGLTTFLEQYSEDDVIAIYMYPEGFDGIDGYSGVRKIWEPNLGDNNDNVLGYAPRNKKLFSYPYNFLLVSNHSGDTATFRWEDWEDPLLRGNFNIMGTMLPNPSALCYPVGYRGMGLAHDDGLVYGKFPVCAWGGDAFKAWWAQNSATLTTNAALGVTTGMGGAISGMMMGAAIANPAMGAAIAAGGIVSGGISALASIYSTIAKVDDAQAMPSQTHGHLQMENLNAILHNIKFTAYFMHIKREYLEIVDSFFDQFGYAVKRCKVPNTHVRQNWTYTKTVGCNIAGTLPDDDRKKICSIFDNGIRFWTNMATFGRFDAANKPI